MGASALIIGNWYKSLQSAPMLSGARVTSASHPVREIIEMGAASSSIERGIIERIKAAKIRLRFDKVALRLADRLRAGLTDAIPDKEAVIFTVTAPIRLPAKTAAMLQLLAREHLHHGDRCEVVHGNQVRIRRLSEVPLHMPKVLCFVHDPASDAGLILALAEACLQEQDRDAEA